TSLNSTMGKFLKLESACCESLPFNNVLHPPARRLPPQGSWEPHGLRISCVSTTRKGRIARTAVASMAIIVIAICSVAHNTEHDEMAACFRRREGVVARGWFGPHTEPCGWARI